MAGVGDLLVVSKSRLLWRRSAIACLQRREPDGCRNRGEESGEKGGGGEGSLCVLTPSGDGGWIDVIHADAELVCVGFRSLNCTRVSVTIPLYPYSALVL